MAITGYRAGNSIGVTIRKLDAASGALTAIVDAGGNATRINSVSYSIQDDSKLVSDARARAFEDAKNRAEQYAKLSGLSLGKIISISEAPAAARPAGADAPRCDGRGCSLAAGATDRRILGDCGVGAHLIPTAGTVQRRLPAPVDPA